LKREAEVGANSVQGCISIIALKESENINDVGLPSLRRGPHELSVTIETQRWEGEEYGGGGRKRQVKVAVDGGGGDGDDDVFTHSLTGSLVALTQPRTQKSMGWVGHVACSSNRALTRVDTGYDRRQLLY